MEQNQPTKKEQRREKAEFKSKIKKGAWIGALLVILGVILTFSMQGSEKQAAVANDLLAVASDDHVVGPAAAPVILVEYLDFECEACGAYYPLVKELEAAYPNDLQIVSRYFPLPSHRNSMTAALAVEAASRQGKYKEMFDMAFQRQREWGEKPAPTPAVFEGYAQELGLDTAKFKEDVASQSVKDRVQRDVNAGNKLGNSGTPTFFLNGKKISNPNGVEAFKKLIDDAIAEARSAREG